MIAAPFALLAAASVAYLPPASADRDVDAAIERAIGAAATPPLRLDRGAPCDDPCAAAAARAGNAERVVTAILRSGDGALLLELHLLDAATGRQLARSRASALGASRLLPEVPGAVAALFSPGARAAARQPAPAPSRAAPAEEKKREDDPEAEERNVEERRRRIAEERRARSEREYVRDLGRIVEEVAADVEKARGLRRKRKLRYQVLDRAQFREAIRSRARVDRAELAATSVRWVAFGLARALADPAKIAVDVIDEDILGFYDPRQGTLYVRAEDSGPGALGEESHLRSVFAHEIEHALQDQNFGLDLGGADRDARLARRALFEGDAMAAQVAYEAMHSRRTARWAIAKRTAALRSVDLIQLAEQHGYSDAISSAPRIVQEESIFPYVWGFGLVSDVFRRGGFSAVDQMFRHPPRTTAQVLDTDSYLAGRGLVRVPTPSGLAGEPGDSGRLGTLGTKAVLATCVDAKIALETARALRGDAYVAVRRPKHGLALAWTTAWRDAEAASVFRNVLEMQKPCWSEQTLAADAGELFVGDEVYVAMEGRRVVLVRGLPDAEAQAVARRSLRFDDAAPADRAPFALSQGTVLVDERDQLMMGTFTSSRLGLRARVPEEFAPIHINAADFAIASRSRGALAAISFVPEAPSEESEKDLFSAYVGDAADWPGGLLPEMPRAGSLWGRESNEQMWVAPNGAFRVRFSIVPACAGRAYFVVVRATRGSVGEDALRGWVSTVERGAGEPPACADL